MLPLWQPVPLGGKEMRFSRRQLRGLGILFAGGQVKRVTDRFFLVKSQTRDVTYGVRWWRGKWRCQCDDCQKTRKPCKHCYSVQALLDLPNVMLANAQATERKCPQCGSQEVRRDGRRQNLTGPVQMYQCRECGAYFRNTPVSSTKGNTTGLFIIALDLYAKKVSTRDISDHFVQVYGVRKAPSTIHFWVQRFERLAVSIAKKEKLNVGNRWLADEMVVRVRGRRMYLWNILDHKTRQLIASLLTNGRGTAEARRVLAEAIRRAGKNPKALVTDALGSYSTALAEMHKPSIKHLTHTALSKKRGNQRIERFHSTVRAWEKAHKRTGNGSGQQFTGYRFYYNRVRGHSAVGHPPSEGGRNTGWMKVLVEQETKRRQRKGSQHA